MNALEMLPPTARDFDIQRMSLVLLRSTRQIAEKHGISQTRVRQVVRRVCDWLAAALPVKTEAQQEQEARLAQHLAADQFRHQSEQLQTFFDATGDPKYLRQQMRAIAALARLGIVPGTIESLAADVTEGPLTGAEPQQPWSEDDAWANQRRAAEDKPGRAPTESASPWPPLTTHHSPSGQPPQPTDNCPLTTDNPSVRACSPSRPVSAEHSPALDPLPAASADAAEVSDRQVALAQDELQGLTSMERRLLSLLEMTAEDDQDRRKSLETSLAAVRKQQACIEIRISPHFSPRQTDGSPLPLPAEPAVECALDGAAIQAPDCGQEAERQRVN